MRRPFFLYLTPASPHRPCDVRPDFVVGASEAGDRGDMVVLFDWVVGQVLDALDRTGQADNTLIMVTSDNGGRLTCADGETYGHPTNGSLRGQKADIWDGGHREPLVARWPGTHPGRKHVQRRSGLPLRHDGHLRRHRRRRSARGRGRGLLQHPARPRRRGAQQPIREALVHHSGDGMFSIRQGQWKLVLGLGSGGFSEPVSVEPTAGRPHRPALQHGDGPCRAAQPVE